MGTMFPRDLPARISARAVLGSVVLLVIMPALLALLARLAYQ